VPSASAWNTLSSDFDWLTTSLTINQAGQIVK
jgi:hypothetical protein